MFRLPLLQRQKAKVCASCGEKEDSERTMKRISARFEKDASLEGIEIIIRASGEDSQTAELMKSFTCREKRKITVFDEKKAMCQVEESDIVTVSADGKCVRIITDQGSYHVKQSLKSVEDILDDRRFLRVSRFEMVNLKKVAKYDFTIGGMLRIEFDNGMETWASRRYIPLIKARITKEDDINA